MRREKALTLLSSFLLSFLLSFSGVLCVVTGFSLSSQGLADLRVLALATLLLLFVSLAQERGAQVRTWLLNRPLVLRWALLLLFLLFILGTLVTGASGADSFMYAVF